MLKKYSIPSYIAQTYTNKNLLIASQSDELVNEQIEKYIQELGRKDITLVRVDPSITLGAARRQACMEVIGGRTANHLVCQFDDDDVSLGARLSTQYNSIIRNDTTGCYYTSHLKYFADIGEVYGIDWSVEPDEYWRTFLTNSVMFYKKKDGVYLNTPSFYSAKNLSEDVDFAIELNKSYRVSTIKDTFHYVYTFHGSNVYGYQFHRAILDCKYIYTKDEMCDRYRTIEQCLEKLPKPIKVMGSDGLAFIAS